MTEAVLPISGKRAPKEGMEEEAEEAEELSNP
jgi:hypothetical protein